MSQKLNKFDKYLDLYNKLVKRNASRYVGDYIAEDIAQETFIKMYRHLPYLEDDMVKQWLLVVSGNMAKDYLRKGGQYEIHSMEPEELEDKMDACFESAEESFEKNDKQKAAGKLLRTACNLLYEKNPKWYYIMLDSYMLGMTSEEIGKVLGTTAGNVDVMKTRARAYLKRKISREYYDFF